MTYQFSIYSRAEAMLLLELAYEHRESVVSRCRETNFFTEIAVHPEYGELQDYFDFMLKRLREQQRHLEAIYRRSPSENRRPSPVVGDPFASWQNPLMI